MPIAGPVLDRPVDLARLLEVGLSSRPDEAALVSHESRWTWRELDEASDRVAGHYVELGLKPGDRVASLLPNRGALLVHYLACLKASLVATPLNYRYQAPEIDHALEVSEAALLVAHAERNDDLARSLLAGRLRLGRVSFGAEEGQERRLEDFLNASPKPVALPAPEKSTPAFIFFTSGSTGKPKGVTHTHETFGWIVASAVAGFELGTSDVLLPGTSASHIAATVLSLVGFAAGARVDLARTYDGDELLPLLRETRPTLLCMLPSALFNLVRDHGAQQADFSSLRMCISGGDKVSAELEREFTNLAGFTIEETYGMSEIGMATMNPPEGPNRIGSIGRLAPGFAASIRDDQGTELATGETGRMWIKSPCNMVGYWNRADATEETIVDGWLDTGDMIAADGDGYLWFRGRKKQIIIHDGSNICPQEVEESLLEHPAVESAGVIGVHDLVHGENVRAYVTLKKESPAPTMAELMKFSRERVGYKAPCEIVVLDEIPLNATGKVDRVALKRLAEESPSAAIGK